MVEGHTVDLGWTYQLRFQALDHLAKGRLRTMSMMTFAEPALNIRRDVNHA
jgi:hypothetical protein